MIKILPNNPKKVKQSNRDEWGSKNPKESPVFTLKEAMSISL